jgi:limonene-1,2-epoxide hydrolase
VAGSKADGSIALVHAFGRAWERCDVEAILAMLAPDAVYANIPVPPMIGRDAIRAFITPNLERAKSTRWEFLATVASADGRQVLTERVDTFFFPEGDVAVPLMGIFEIEGQLIKRWRDYADIGTFVRDMAAIGAKPGPGIAV